MTRPHLEKKRSISAAEIEMLDRTLTRLALTEEEKLE
jgi:hypothetical protein